jgi:3-methyladenine DNA glycosylase AlkD
MEMLAMPQIKFNPEDIKIIEYMITTKSWWDTVDMVAASLAGKYFIQYPDSIRKVTGEWIKSDNIWLKRSALLFQLKYKAKTDFNLMCEYIRKEASHKDFFIRKAIGWVLREYSKTNSDSVKYFISNTVLSPLSKKEGLKIINKNIKDTANES